MKKPGKSDPSRPRDDGYDYKREFYRSATVAEDYDFHRFSSPERQKRNRRKWAAITKALREATGVRTILDLPAAPADSPVHWHAKDLKSSAAIFRTRCCTRPRRFPTDNNKPFVVTARRTPNTCRCATTRSTAWCRSAS